MSESLNIQEDETGQRRYEMTTNVDLNELERNAYRSNFEDGLWDMFLGLLLFQNVIGTLLYRLDWSPAVILLAILGYVIVVLVAFTLAKKYVITPRMGLVNFSPARKAKRRKLTLVLSLACLLGVIVFAAVTAGYFKVASGALTDWTAAVFVPFALFTVVSVVVFSLAAYLLDYPRAYLYGWFFGLASPLNIWLDETFGISVPLATAVFSGIMVLIGLILFVRFLQKYPLPGQKAMR